MAGIKAVESSFFYVFLRREIAAKIQAMGYLAKMTRAADSGDMAAQRFLGLIYFLGDGVSRDYIESHKWLSLAARQGEEIAVAVVEYVLPRLSTEDLAESNRRIEIAQNEQKNRSNR